MPKITKRSLLGYAPDAVEALSLQWQSEHEKKSLELQAQIEELTHANEQLRQDIVRLRESENAMQTVERQVADLLLQEHLKQTRLVYEFQEESKAMEEKEQELLTALQWKRESVMHEVMERLQQLGLKIQWQAKEGDHA